MTTSSWTRGYIISQKTHYIYCETPEGDCEDVCKVCDSTTDERTEERVLLIAAAPDLLEALTELTAWVEELVPTNRPPTDTRVSLLNKSKAAIAKAEGTQSLKKQIAKLEALTEWEVQ